MRIVFFGATELGYQCCEKLLQQGEAIVGIFTIEQNFNISNSSSPVKNVLFRDFNSLGKQFNIPVITINGNLKSHLAQLTQLNPDFLLVVGWYYMIPKSMLTLAPKGAAAIHASLLPAYRGNAPLVWAMINGEKETGVSFFYISEGVDEGDIIAQEIFAIEDSDTIKELLNKTSSSAINIVSKYVPLIRKGSAPRIPQFKGITKVYVKRNPEDGLIDWNWDANAIKNFIRAQTKPYPGAYTFINNKKVIIWDADIIDE